MLKVFSRIRRPYRNFPTAYFVDNQIREVAVERPFSMASLTHHTWCVQPVLVDGVETSCGKPVEGLNGSQGWLCQGHYLRESGGRRTGDEDALRLLDADNIKYIIGQDKRNRKPNEGPLFLYRGWVAAPDYNAPDIDLIDPDYAASIVH